MFLQYYVEIIIVSEIIFQLNDFLRKDLVPFKLLNVINYRMLNDDTVSCLVFLPI